MTFVDAAFFCDSLETMATDPFFKALILGSPTFAELLWPFYIDPDL